ncbi:MAG: acylphosphatase [Armatimonadota bacterium]|nr:acylphosphatase [Armatimonadota bacterium]
MRQDRSPRRSREGAASTPVRVHLWVSGRVQGVGFRFFVQRHAAMRRLAGFVRNLPDGRVEIAVEGPADDVRALVDAVRTGPPGSVVREVHQLDEAPVGEAGFLIRTDRDAIYG